MPKPSVARLAALAMILALAACSGAAGGIRASGEPIERGTALPPPGLEPPPLARN